jgi:tRNA (mo5U34)-methyltransferase
VSLNFGSSETYRKPGWGALRESLDFMTKHEIEKLVSTFSNWYHQIELYPGVITPGVNDTRGCLSLLDLPEDLSGQRVLDIGARDGFYSFECERRGAEVVAIDYIPAEQTGFLIAKQILGSRVEMQQENLYQLRPETFGRFDLVLCLGVFYHLRDPLLALDILRSLTAGRLILETHIIDDGLLMSDGTTRSLKSIARELTDLAIVQFYPGAALNRDYTNYWGVTMRAMELMLSEANFRVIRSTPNGQRGVFDCTIESDPRIEYFARIARATVDRAG